MLLRSNDPTFLTTVGAQLPWEEEACFTRILMHERASKETFHKIDVFHTVSLGVGKSFAASSFTLIQLLVEGNSLPARFEELSSLYLEFCRDPWF